jgi:catechol 2,3-dioxygenase-like lactoylglutathione lyase family enzyme
MPALSFAKPITFIITRDRVKAEAYYGETLGLRLSYKDDFAAVYDLAGTSLRITEVPDFVPQPHTALGWVVPDIEASVRELATKGVRFTVYDGYGQDALGIWTSPDGITKVAWFNDPDGNVLSLTQG